MKIQPKPLLAQGLSLILVLALLFNVVLTPVNASTPQVLSVSQISPACPDSLIVTSTKEAKILLEQFGVLSEDVEDVDEDSQVERPKSQEEVTDPGEKHANDETPSTASANKNSQTDEEPTAPGVASSSRGLPQQQKDFWGTLGEFWSQIRELRIEMPDLSFEEAREVWSQIRELRIEMPDLSFEEAREVWNQIRELRIEMPDLSFEEAREVWGQLRKLQIEMPDLSFEEAREVWNQIRELRIEMPDLSFEEAREVWGQLRKLQIEMPDLSFEEAREVWGQIRELRIEVPDLSFEEAREVWNQIRELRIEVPDLSFEQAKEAWSQIRELRAEMPDLSFEDAQEVWGQIRELRIEMPDLSFEDAREVWSQLRKLQIEMPDLSFEQAKEVWGQIRELQIEMPDLSFEDAREVWGQIRELQIEMPDLSFEDAREVWGQIRELRIEMPVLSFEQAREVWDQLRKLQIETPDLTLEEVTEVWLNGLAKGFEEEAREILSEQGFEDTDGDGDLNWPPGSPFSGKNVDFELIIGGTGGLVIGFVPVLGDAVDIAALTIGTDPFTGECLTTFEQVLLAIAIIGFLPVSVRGVKFVGKQLDNFQPAFRKLLVNSLPNFPVSVRGWLISDLVDPKYKDMRVIIGDGAKNSKDLASDLGFESFNSLNYRKSLREFTGVSEEAAKDFEAHHILPQRFEEKFLESGFETIHDPRLIVWVDNTGHKSWSPAYNQAWIRFFEQYPNPSRRQVLDEARRLAAKEFGYQVLFKTSQ